MRFLLNSAKICGIKNIDKELSFSFTNKAMSDGSFDESYVKTIYGSNGAGKSGLVHAFEITRTIATTTFPFKDPLFASKLVELINKRTKRFSIELVFSCSEKKMFRYSLAVSVSDGLGPYISFESLEELNARGDFKNLFFKVEDGVLSKDSDPSLFMNELPPRLARESTLIAPKSIGEEPVHDAAYIAFSFFVGLNIVFGGESDKHTSFDVKSLHKVMHGLKAPNDPINFNPSTVAAITSQVDGNKYLWVLHYKAEEHYRSVAKKLCSFLHLAKPDLKDVEVAFKRNGIWSYAELRFNYGDYSIDYEFESTGIKKLCALFTALMNASSGSIVIIDEVDAGIHDLFLVNLIEYFALYSPCQIIMTTHSIDLMASVEGLSKSIDILTDEPSVVPWVKKGTLSPISQYKKGYLGGVPVNLSPIDFAPIFNDEE